MLLPRDAMRKCGLCCRPVSDPSVRPSVCHVHAIILVFMTQAPIPISKQNRPGGAQDIQGWGNLRL